MPAGNTAPPQLQRVRSPSPSVLTGQHSTLPFAALCCPFPRLHGRAFLQGLLMLAARISPKPQVWHPAGCPQASPCTPTASALDKHLSITKTVRLCHHDTGTHSYKSSIHWSAQPLAKHRAWQCFLSWQLAVMQASCNNFSTAGQGEEKIKPFLMLLLCHKAPMLNALS